MVGNTIRSVLSEARDCALIMLESSEYILKELRNVKIGPNLTGRTRAVCEAINATKHDVMSELFEIDDLLASTDDEGAVSDRIDRILQWLQDDLPELHSLVTELDAAAKADPACTTAYFLVAESAANIFNAVNRTTRAAATTYEKK